MTKDFTEHDDLKGARFTGTDLSGARLHNVIMVGTKISGAWLKDVDISGLLDGGVVVNGVDIGPLVEAELNRRDPDRAKMQPSTADGFREAWEIVERRWADTVERARRLPEAALHERVDEEWSFVETLRHLVFATDAWVSRVVLGAEDPFHPWGVTHLEEISREEFDKRADPSLDDVLAVRAERHAVIRGLLADLTDEELDRVTEQNPASGYPDDTVHPVRRCLGAIVNEEWEHRTFAERDLAVLESR